MSRASAGGDWPVREVVVGRNSKIWRVATRNAEVASRFTRAIGHADVERFGFTPEDRVWIFSYSRVPGENLRLLAQLQGAAVREVVYVSSASTIVTKLTRCYEYPRVKEHAENEARRRLGARVLTLGLVYAEFSELAAGANVATSQAMLEHFLLVPTWPEREGEPVRLFEVVHRPFSSQLEALLYRGYGALQWAVRGWPCILRPLDYVLRAAGIRWYGYIHLSNRLWISTTS
jgi:hypothetical protein